MERVVTVKGHRVRYLAAGSGRALVLLHGLGESPADWSRSFPGSHRRGRLCAPALPGFDGQDEPAHASAEGYARFLGRFLDAVGVERRRSSAIRSGLVGCCSPWRRLDG